MTTPIANIDNTTLLSLTSNLDIGDVADPALRLTYFQYLNVYIQTITTAFNAFVANGGIATANLADLSVTSAKLADLAVATGKIADLAVVTAKINDLAVTAAKIAVGTITSTQIADLGIATGDLADALITTIKIADANVTTAKLIDSCVTLAKMADASVGTAELVDLSVTTAKIAIGAVGSGQLNPNLLTNFGDIAVQAEFDRRGLDVMKYGATGDGVTDDTAAIQAAITACPTGGIVFFPPPSVYYKVTGNIQLKGNITLQGSGKYANGIHGTGVAPIFLTGIYPAGNLNTNRGITISHLNVQNTNYPVANWYTALNFIIYQCYLLTSNADCLKIRYSFRGRIQDCDIQTSGLTYFAISAFDNCNGVYIEKNNISGGTVGGAVDIANSQNVAVNKNIIETGYYGIRVADSQGNVNGFEVNNNYFEQVRDPIILGRLTSAYGGTVKNNYIANTSYPSAPTFGIGLGRVGDTEVSNNSCYGKGAEPFIMFYYNTGSGINYFTDGVIEKNYSTGYGSNYAYDATFTNPNLSEGIFSSCRIQFNGGSPSGKTVYISPTYTSSVALTTSIVIPVSTEGGVIDSIQIIDAVGTVNCTMRVGTLLNTQDILADLNLGTLVYTYGSAPALTLAGTRIRRGYGVLLSFTAGAGTGTFRVKITYRS